MHLLVVAFGGVRAGVPLASVAGVQQCDGARRLALPDIGAAIVSCGSHQLACVDPAAVLLAGQTASRQDNRVLVIILDFGTRKLGLLVDEVHDVISVPPRTLRWLPPLLLKSSHPALHAIACLEGDELLPVVAPEFLLSGAQLAALDRALELGTTVE
jgi:hypothetical protein